MKTRPNLVRMPGRISRNQEKALQELVDNGSYASIAEAIREAINRFIVEEQSRALVNALGSRVAIGYDEFRGLSKSARLLVVDTPPEKAVSEKKPLTLTAFGVKLGGIELSTRHTLLLDRDQDFIDREVVGDEEKDLDGDKFVKTTYYLKEGQKVEFRDYRLTKEYQDLERARPSPMMEAALSELGKEHPTDSSWYRLNKKIAQESKVLDCALAECKQRRIKQLLPSNSRVLVGTLDEDIVRLQALRVIYSIVKGAQ